MIIMHYKKPGTRMLNRTFTSFPVLTTGRLTLRQLNMNDDQQIFSLRSDSEINKYLDRPISSTIDDARDFIQKVISSGALYWAITPNDNDVLAGTICLFGFSEENDNCEIGYELLTNFQGKGIMQEAAEQVIDYAFNSINIQKIEACFHPDNLASARLLHKLSFTPLNETGKETPGLTCYQLTNKM